MKYLYGAAVKGIQGFIFQTNKLREIVGASELVEEICTSKFKEIVGGSFEEYDDQKGYGSILHAAGNIKYIFADEESCAKVVRIFPKEISEFSPGVTVSQAVVKMEGENSDFKKAVNELEKRLRAQRNRPMRSVTLGLMGIERSRQTGLPVVDMCKVKGKITPVDAGTRAKLDMFKNADDPKFELTKSLCNTAFGIKSLRGSQVAYDIEDMTENNDWVAVIHADGNGLGLIVQQLGTDAQKFMDFSESLDKATKQAAVNAYQDVKHYFNEDRFIPIRPIVLGGDDFTVVCQARIALEYVTAFIKHFEEETGKLGRAGKLGNLNKLTVCAGIAYIKSSFPFYYGYNLAEALCSRAKKDAKKNLAVGELAKSCLMFHKVQDSFTEDFDAIAERELTPQDNISFEFGPYYVNEKKNSRWLVQELIDKANTFDGKEGNAVKSHLRNWLSLLHDNPEMANQKLARLKSMTTKAFENFVNEISFTYQKEKQFVTPVYDLLSIHTINTQNTKED